MELNSFHAIVTNKNYLWAFLNEKLNFVSLSIK